MHTAVLSNSITTTTTTLTTPNRTNGKGIPYEKGGSNEGVLTVWYVGCVISMVWHVNTEQVEDALYSLGGREEVKYCEKLVAGKVSEGVGKSGGEEIVCADDEEEGNIVGIKITVGADVISARAVAVIGSVKET